MSDGRVRLFVALELPESARKALDRWRSRLSVDPDRTMREVAPEALHATLCFLGWQTEDEVETIAATCSIVAGEPPALLRLRQALWLPPRQPRVLAVELDDEEGVLQRVQATLSAALAAGGWYEPEKRPYLPHVTVARVAPVRGGSRPGGTRSRESREKLPEPPQIEFRGSRVVLYRSRLFRSGARYEALSVVVLGG